MTNDDITLAEYLQTLSTEETTQALQAITIKTFSRISIIDDYEIKDAMNIAKSRVRYYLSLGWPFAYTDLESAAYEGVAEAIQRYEPKRGTVQDTKFTSYAYFWIEKYLKEYITLNKTILSGSMGEHWAGEVPYATSIDYTDDDRPANDCTVLVQDKATDSSADYHVIQQETSETVEFMTNQLLACLDNIERIVVQLTFGLGTLDDEPMTVADIAKDLACTKAYIQGVYDAAVRKMSETNTELARLYIQIV